MTDAPPSTHADVGLPEVVSPTEGRASFEALVTREKALTAARDERLAATTRRVLPVVMAGSAVGGDRRHHLRPAEPHDAKELEEVQDRSASHRDHPDGHFDWAGVTTSGRSHPC